VYVVMMMMIIIIIIINNDRERWGGGLLGCADGATACARRPSSVPAS
jgi:hypothetical protein